MAASASGGTSPESDGKAEIRPADQVGARKESILTGGINDKETLEDSLGFAPYVDALAAFLANPATKPPLTISIEGKWGSGKSSFMRQLAKRLTDAEKSWKTRHQSFVFWFNPWRHDKQEALWAAFALDFLTQVRKDLRRQQRFRGDLRLFWSRFDWRSGWTDMVRKVLQWIWWLTMILTLLLLSVKVPAYLQAVRKPMTTPPPAAANKNVREAPVIEPLKFLNWAIPLNGILGALVLTLRLFRIAKKELENPIKVDLQRHLKRPGYEGSVAFVEGFHKDFPKILRAYTGDRRVYVFVDDLDRCDVPRAADLMQAINLMIANDPQLVFVIGMDWETVAAGIAVKNEALSRYLVPDARDGRPDTRDSMELGRGYLDKFVQLRFKLPRPWDEDLRRLLLALSRPVAANTDDRVNQRRRTPWLERRRLRLRARIPDSNAERMQLADAAVSKGTELQELIEFGTSADSDTVQTVALRLMPAFDNNPRRLKQFLGLYRLRIYIAKVTGMFAIPKGRSADEALSLPQLGKFTALELGWPDLLEEVQREPGLLGRLEQADPGQKPTGVDWLQRKGLANVIQAGLDGDAATRKQWSLADLDASRILRVSALVGAFDAKVGRPPSPPEVETRPHEELTAKELFERGVAAIDKNEKLRLYSEAIRLKPDYVLAFLNRGNVRSELGDLDEALADYNEAIRLKPHDAFALYNRGMAYSDRGSMDRALMDYDEAIRLKSDDADAFINRGIARAGNDDVVGGLMDFDQAIQLRRDDPDVYYNRGTARRRKGDLEGALMDYNQAILLKPDDPDAFFNRAITRRARGDREGAAMDFAEASRLEPHK